MALVSRGLREGDDGSRSEIGDAALAGALKLRARGVWIRTVLATAAITAALLALPHED